METPTSPIQHRCVRPRPMPNYVNTSNCVPLFK